MKALLVIICIVFAAGLGAATPMVWDPSSFTGESLYCALVGAWVGRWLGARVSF